MFSLKGRVAVVTGASSGLGLQMAKGFAGQGACGVKKFTLSNSSIIKKTTGSSRKKVLNISS